jgi:hypothetical protein
MMLVPEAANKPPTPCQTEILAPGIWAGATPRIWRTLSCSAYVGKPAAISVERQLSAVGGVALGNETAGLTATDKTQILEAVDRQMRKACPWQRTGGVVDHQMVDVVVHDAGTSRGAGDAERA